MAKRGRNTARRGAGYGAMTPVRAARIYRLVKLLTKSQLPRRTLLTRLRVGVRTFYRDLNYLRAGGVVVDAVGEKYSIKIKLADILNNLVFPDPKLTFREAMELGKGRGPGAAKVKALVNEVTRP